MAACGQGEKVRLAPDGGDRRVLRGQSASTCDSVADLPAKPGLLILDELDYVPASRAGAKLLFDVIATAYDRQIVIVATNLRLRIGPGSWTTSGGQRSKRDRGPRSIGSHIVATFWKPAAKATGPRRSQTKTKDKMGGLRARNATVHRAFFHDTPTAANGGHQQPSTAIFERLTPQCSSAVNVGFAFAPRRLGHIARYLEPTVAWTAGFAMATAALRQPALAGRSRRNHGGCRPG